VQQLFKMFFFCGGQTSKAVNFHQLSKHQCNTYKLSQGKDSIAMHIFDLYPCGNSNQVSSILEAESMITFIMPPWRMHVLCNTLRIPEIAVMYLC
jgi:hypothetical protein